MARAQMRTLAVSAAAAASFLVIGRSAAFTATAARAQPARFEPAVMRMTGMGVQSNPEPRSAPAAAMCMLAGIVLAGAARQMRIRAGRRNQQVVRRVLADGTLEYGEDLDIPDDSYIVCGIAHCFEQKDGGKLQDVWVLEPITASTVEVVDNGALTSHEAFIGCTVGEIMKEDASVFPEELLCGHEVQWCEELKFRTGCAARTWMRDHAREVVSKLAPDGKVIKTMSRGGDFNTSTQDKRILNFENEVSDSDNVKQDMSIDAYGRESAEDDLNDQIAALNDV